MDISGLETRNQLVAGACLSAVDLLVHEVCYTWGDAALRCFYLFIYLVFLVFLRENTHNNETELYKQGVPDPLDQKEFCKPGSDLLIRAWHPSEIHLNI